MATRKRASRKNKPAFAPYDYEVRSAPEHVVVELRYDSGVAIEPAARRGRFAAAERNAARADALNEVLAGFDVKSLAPRFAMKPKALELRASEMRGARPRVSADYAQGGMVQIVPKHARDAARLADKLSRSKAVWRAWVAPRPVPAAVNTGASAGSRNFEPAQGYLASAPNGIGALGVRGLRGAAGSGITVCDIEGNWNLAHEDLPPGITLVGGTLINQLSWRNHGTAVLGEIVSRPGQIGTCGIAPGARAVVHACMVNGVFNTAAAIMGALAVLRAGDVILIELQATGPNNKYVAMQYWNDVFSAIRVATERGVTVVEAAGNGDENFDLAMFNNTGLQKDSGAIVVGAGIPPTDYFDVDGFGSQFAGYSRIGVPRSRIWFSNYGRIVDVQGWGWHVTTCGYGDAQGGASENRWYTHRFSGTSSASPIVTGAVAVMQGIAKAKNGAPLSPADVRTILKKTGTPQVAGPGVPLTQRIGPLPDLERAIAQI